jgi:sec-independent protein translocase protein TatC
MSPAPERLAPAPSTEELPRMSLIDHLEELRRRILWSLAFLTVMLFPCWAFHERIFDFLQQPILAALPPGKHLAYTGLVDPFLLYFKVAALAALFLSTPFVLYQVWKFVAPGLYRRERYYVLPFILSGTICFLSGGAFAYYIAFPYAAKFLLGMGKDFEPVITIERYLSFLLSVILGLSLMFELPIIIFVLCQIGVVTPRFLMRHFRYAVLATFVVAAIVTPTPDVLTMCLFAAPMLVLYLAGVGAAAIAAVPRRRRAAAEAAAAAAASAGTGGAGAGG